MGSTRLIDRIVLTDTVHIGLAYDSVVRYMTERDPEIADKDVVIPVVAETDDSFLSDNRAFGIRREDVYAALTPRRAAGSRRAVLVPAPAPSSSTSRVASALPPGSSSYPVSDSRSACWCRPTT